ncbi:Vesicle-mediated transporter, partial [Globisporangium splendens]
MHGSFRDLHLSDTGSSSSNGNANGRNLKNRSPTSAGNKYPGPDANSNMNNYSTFSNDQSVQTLLRQSNKIEHTKNVMYESEEVARNVLVDLELQRSQMQDMKGMLHETSSITGEVRSLLKKIADRSYRRKVCCMQTAISMCTVHTVRCTI